MTLRRSPLKRRKFPRMMPPKEGAPISCPRHLQFVRGFECVALGKTATAGPLAGQKHECWGGIEAHHVTTRGAGGGDDETAPVCRGLHSLLDSPGWSQPLVEKAYGIDFHAIAADLWKQSKPGREYRRAREIEAQEAVPTRSPGPD